MSGAHAVQAFGKAAFFEGGFSLGCQLAVQEMTGQVQEGQGGVGCQGFGGERLGGVDGLCGLTRTNTDGHGPRIPGATLPFVRVSP